MRTKENHIDLYAVRLSSFRLVKLALVSLLLLSARFSIAAEPTPLKPAEHSALTLWYDTPAHDAMNEALPVGNAHLGALIFGDPSDEKLVLNDDSLWTGGNNPSGNDDTMGNYQILATLHLKLDGQQSVTNYSRDLDIAHALSHVHYTVDNVTYTREVFASHPAGVIVMQLSASRPGSYTGVLSLEDGHQAKTLSTTNTLQASGQLSNGLKYESRVQVLHNGGDVHISNGEISFKNCSSMTVLVDAGTNYAEDFTRNYRGPDPHQRILNQLRAASTKNYPALKAEHVADYERLFGRVSLDLGQSTPEQQALPTNLRKRQAATQTDPELEALLFQYGRYLLISSSRPGGLPANLQGLWNDSNTPAWHSDYHSNINVEMNYWPAEVTNLSECAVPFFNLVESQIPAWKITTQNSPDLLTPSGKKTPRGFAIRTSHNIMGGMGWNWDRTANAWYAQLFWEHYAFGRDRQYLQSMAYPLLRETTEFWEDHLKALPNGQLVVPDSWSPEHGPVQDGVSYSQEIVWDLFSNYIDAADALQTDEAYRTRIAGLRDKLALPGVGSWGQLLEWHNELHDPVLDTPNDHHRHTSHLFGVYPGREISIETTPALAAAARTSLIARGDTGDVREWSFAWRTSLWARLRDGELAHHQIQELLQDRNTTPNLFGYHPPVQLDGNFGITAGIAEMLLQSQTGTIELLPALPQEWSTGSVSGLKARGDYTITMKWRDHTLSSVLIHGKKDQTVHLRYREKTTEAVIPSSGHVLLGEDLQPTVSQ
jgi:alpha-L-fucosidase 2